MSLQHGNLELRASKIYSDFDMRCELYGKILSDVSNMNVSSAKTKCEKVCKCDALTNNVAQFGTLQISVQPM